MKNTKILVYVREYFKYNYVPLFNKIDFANIDYLTDFPTIGMHNIRDLFYTELNNLSTNQRSPLFLDEVVYRCRYLRSLTRKQALRLSEAMYNVMFNLIKMGRYKVVFGQFIDDYITHVLYLAAKDLNVPYVGLCESYFSGYTQVTTNPDGRPFIFRDVENSEAQLVLDMYSRPNYRRDYTSSISWSLQSHLKKVAKYHLKLILFNFLKIYKNDPMNLHYNIQNIVAQPKKITDFPTKKYFDYDWSKRLVGNANQCVYLPLSVTPECSVDYMVSNMDFIDYENKIIEILRELSLCRLVLVKEHMHMLGSRKKDFYDKIRGIRNVLLIPPDTISNNILEEIKPIVLVGASSPGVEAAMRRLSIITFSSTSYWFGFSNARFVYGKSGDFKNIIPPQDGMLDPLNFIRGCLSTLLPFDYLNPNEFDKSHSEYLFMIIKQLDINI